MLLVRRTKEFIPFSQLESEKLRFRQIVFFNWIAKFKKTQEIAVLEGQIAVLTHDTESLSVVASFGIKDFKLIQLVWVSRSHKVTLKAL